MRILEAEMRRVVPLVMLGLVLGACGTGEDTTPADTQVLLPGAGDTLGRDTLPPNAAGDTIMSSKSSPISKTGTSRSTSSKTQSTDTTPPSAPRPREGMRPEARDTKPWQVPPPDSGKTPD